MTVVLTASDLRYVVGDRTILDGISVQASSGRALAVRGPTSDVLRRRFGFVPQATASSPR